MGFLQLIPAENLSALYNTQSKKLVLFAKGNVIEFTSAISFNRDPNFVGGLKFFLEGWVGPITGKKSPYNYKQGFDIVLPSPIPGFNSKSVIIADANDPKGKEVPVHYVGIEQTVPSALAGEDISAPETTIPQSVLPGHIKINALFKEPFQIRESASVPKGGEVSIKFNPNFIEIVNAGVQDGDIVWTFNSLQMGNTQVIVTITGGIATYVMQKIYDVRVFVLDQVRNDPSGAILDFLGRVNIAVRQVREKYPDAQLYEVDAVSKLPTTNPNDLSQLKVVFRAGRGTAIIQSTGWGEFGPVQYIDQPWLEDVVIPWPISMDLSEADKLLKAAGYKGNYSTATLRHPLYPGVEQPFYIFGMTTGEYVFVGVYDKKVTVNQGEKKTAAPAKTSGNKNSLQTA